MSRDVSRFAAAFEFFSQDEMLETAIFPQIRFYLNKLGAKSVTNVEPMDTTFKKIPSWFVDTNDFHNNSSEGTVIPFLFFTVAPVVSHSKFVLNNRSKSS